VRAAPGAPSHVMLDDEEAEHLPGCNLSVTRAAFEAVGGFDPRFRTAGDDVDFCWRLRDAGHRLGFAPGAFVWHWRRASLRAFLQQQAGYGHAERLLMTKHPARFSSRGEARWLGFVYGGGPVRVADGSIIYHGPMGAAGYQSVLNRMLPLRGLDPAFSGWRARMELALVNFAASVCRAWKRNCRLPSWRGDVRDPARMPEGVTFTWPGPREIHLERLLAEGWKPGGATDGWDLSKDDRRILLATGHAADFSCHTLVREWRSGN
jgi:Glycosyl transferase family group 2